MKTGTFAAFAITLLGAAPAAATIVEIQFTGVVADVFTGGDTTGVVAGDTAHARVRYDPAHLVDVTAVANAILGGPVYTKLQAATLTDPGAGLKIGIGPQHFTAGDQLPVPDPFGAGNPYILLRDGAFFGVQYFGVNAWPSAFVTAGFRPEFYDFVGGSPKLGGPSYGGYFDYAGARFNGAVPEPGNWALMIAGFGLIGAALRRREAGTLMNAAPL